jgi:hypothetical protein
MLRLREAADEYEDEEGSLVAPSMSGACCSARVWLDAPCNGTAAPEVTSLWCICSRSCACSTCSRARAGSSAGQVSSTPEAVARSKGEAAAATDGADSSAGQPSGEGGEGGSDLDLLLLLLPCADDGRCRSVAMLMAPRPGDATAIAEGGGVALPASAADALALGGDDKAKSIGLTAGGRSSSPKPSSEPAVR